MRNLDTLNLPTRSYVTHENATVYLHSLLLSQIRVLNLATAQREHDLWFSLESQYFAYLLQLFVVSVLLLLSFKKTISHTFMMCEIYPDKMHSTSRRSVKTNKYKLST